MTSGSEVSAAAIDIGSNSIKMTVARLDETGEIEQFDWASEVVRLGQGLDQTGRLEDERIEAAVQTLWRFAARAEELGATQVLAVATEATRSAVNGAAFLRRVREETGINVRVVDGNEEAALTFRGLSAETDLTGLIVIADIGGGSTEIVVADNGALQAARSIPLGSGRLTDRHILADPPSPVELQASEADAAAAIAGVLEKLSSTSLSEARLILVGGTGEYLARLVPDEQQVTLSSVRNVMAKIETLSAAELAAEIEIPEARARVLPAGAAIVAALAELLRPDHIEISRSGIRTGLLREAFFGAEGANGGVLRVSANG